MATNNYERDVSTAKGQRDHARLEKYLGDNCYACGHPFGLHDKSGFCAACEELTGDGFESECER